MKIQFVRPTSPIGYGYSDGQELVCAKAFGKEMIELGYAIELEEGNTDIPMDFPGRKVLEENGILSMAELKRIATVEHLTEIKGIGNKLAESIINAIPQ